MERIEILKDGGRPLYGSDAIAGVVNIITRKRMDGVELNGLQRRLGPRRRERLRHQPSRRTQSTGGSFMFGAGYFDQHTSSRRRDWAANALSWDFTAKQEGPSGSGTPPKVRVNAPRPARRHLHDQALRGHGDGLAPSSPRPDRQGRNFIYDPAHTRPASPTSTAGASATRDLDFYNYLAVNYLVTPSSASRCSETASTGWPTSPVRTSRPRTCNAIEVPVLARAVRHHRQPDLVVSAGNPYNPFGLNLTSLQRRLTRPAAAADDFDVTPCGSSRASTGTLGIRGSGIGGRDASINYGRTYGTDTRPASSTRRRPARGLGRGSWMPAERIAARRAAPIENCTPINLFGAPGTIDPDMATQLGAYTGPNPGTTNCSSRRPP